MPDFNFTGPDGKPFTITGPEGSTPQDALKLYQSQQHDIQAKVVSAGIEASYGPKGAGEIATEALRSAPGSAVQFAKDVVQPIAHPIDTYHSIKSLGRGILAKTGIMSGDPESERVVDDVGLWAKHRWGSVAAIKHTMATDPVGFAGDLSMFLTGGGTAAARVPGLIGVAGKAARFAGDVVNPLNVAGQTVKGAAKVGAEVYGGLMTGTGGKPLRQAGMAGAQAITDPSQGAEFLRNYTGRVDPSRAVDIAQGAMDNLIKQRGSEYAAAMKTVGQNKAVLDFKKIDQAVVDGLNIGKFKGVVTNPSTNAVRQQILDKVQMWKQLPAADYHTAEGIDALKKSISDIRNEPGNTDSFGRLTASGLVAEKVAKGITQTITDAAPEYAKVMKSYSEASDIIENLQRELSLGRNANVDTGLRKLQSVMRNNVNTSFGRRETLANFLAENGATTLLSALAGQSLSTLIPRGLAAKVLAGLEGLTGMGIGGSEGLLKGLGVATASSPMLAGGAAFAGGVAASPAYAAMLAGRKVGLPPSRVGLGTRASQLLQQIQQEQGQQPQQ